MARRWRGKRRGQPGVGIDGVQFADLDERGDHWPVQRFGVMASEERVLAVERNRPDCAFHGVSVDLDPTVVQESTMAVPMFGDVFQRHFGGDAGAASGEPALERVDDRL